jgi:hypothetical protein
VTPTVEARSGLALRYRTGLVIIKAKLVAAGLPWARAGIDLGGSDMTRSPQGAPAGEVGIWLEPRAIHEGTGR